MAVHLIKIFIICTLLSLAGCARAADPSAPPVTRSMPASDGLTTGITVSAADTEAQLLGSFATEFNPKEKNRSHNIALASEKINGHVVAPQETFSYNETVGPTGRSRGYKRSTIFIKGEMFKGYGGGVCQVSSTLYNAAANAGMTILERHDHSKPVPYVETGKDAATSYGGIDFKFKNEQPYSVQINAQAEDGTLTISLSAV